MVIWILVVMLDLGGHVRSWWSCEILVVMLDLGGH